jgi:hypothetical protein
MYNFDNEENIKEKFLNDNINNNYNYNDNDNNLNNINYNISGRKSLNLEYSKNGEYNTLNESILISLKRELMRILYKLFYAIIPRFSANKDTNLKQWDLFGPLFFTIFLSYFLNASKDTEEMSRTFIIVFCLMWIGGSIVTINVILLGSHITLFQSLSILGYCIFPILLASMINYFFKSLFKFGIKVAIASGAYIWCCFSSVSFMSDVLGQEKKGLGLFPIFLFYFAFTCYLLL